MSFFFLTRTVRVRQLQPPLFCVSLSPPAASRGYHLPWRQPPHLLLIPSSATFFRGILTEAQRWITCVNLSPSATCSSMPLCFFSSGLILVFPPAVGIHTPGEVRFHHPLPIVSGPLVLCWLLPPFWSALCSFCSLVVAQ